MENIDDLQDIGMGPECPRCGNATDWLPCWNCGGDGGFDGYDDDPLWYDEGDVIVCGHCHGTGGWWMCGRCGQYLGEGGENGDAAASSIGGGAGEVDAEFLEVVKKLREAANGVTEAFVQVAENIKKHISELYGVPPVRECACVDRDRGACFRIRYGIEDMRDLAEEGGPCECECHDRYEAWEEGDASLEDEVDE